jgi:hypothetical protein
VRADLRIDRRITTLNLRILLRFHVGTAIAIWGIEEARPPEIYQGANT